MTEELRSPRMDMDLDGASDQVKSLGEKLTLLNGYVHNELLKLKEMLSDKALKKRIEKCVEPQIDEVNERIDEEVGGGVKKIEEHVTELHVIYDEMKKQLLAALSVQVESNTKEIALVKQNIGQLMLDSQKELQNTDKQVRVEVQKLSKTIEVKAPKSALDGTQKDVSQVSQEVEKLKARLATFAKDIQTLRKSIPGIDVMSDAMKRVNDVRDELDRMRSAFDTKVSMKALEDIKRQCATKEDMKAITQNLNKIKSDLASLSATFAQMRAEGGRTPAIKAVENLFFRRMQEMQDESIRIRGEVAKEATTMAIKDCKKEFVTTADFKQSKAAQDKKVDVMYVEMDRLKQSLESRSGNALNSAMDVIRQFSQELERMKQEIYRVKGALEKAQNQAGGKNTEKEMNALIKKVTTELSQVKKKIDGKAADKALQQTSGNVVELANEVEDLKAEMSRLGGKINGVQAASVNVDNHNAAVDQYRSQFEVIQTEIETLKKDIGMKADLEVTEAAQREFARKHELDRIVQELEKLKSETGNIESSVDEIKSPRGSPDDDEDAKEMILQKMKELSEKIESLRSVVDTKSSLSELDEKVSNEEMAHATQEIERLRNEIKEISRVVESVKDEPVFKETDVKQEIDDKSSEIKSEIESVKEHAEAKGYQEELAQIQTRVDQFEGNMRKLCNETLTQATTDVHRLEETSGKKFAEVQEEFAKFYPNVDGKALENRIKALEESLPQLSERSVSLDQDSCSDNLKSIIESMKGEITEMKAQLTRAAEQTEPTSETDSETSAYAQALQQRLDNMEKDIAALREAVSAPSDASGADDSETKKLREEIDEIKKRLDKIPQDDEIITRSRLSGVLSPLVVIIFLLLLGMTIIAVLHRPNRAEYLQIRKSFRQMKVIVNDVNDSISQVAVAAMKK